MIPVDQAHLIVAAQSHPGMIGKNNEDRYAVSAYLVSETYPVPSLLALVADGVGGNRAGEVAAELAVETISRHIAASDASQPVEILKNAFQSANTSIYDQAQQGPAQHGMGTTCVCAWVIGEQLYATWVGDSRLYLIRDHGLQQLSIDHTFVQDALDQGMLTTEQARNTPVRHVIHRYLGMSQPVQPDFRLRLRSAEDDRQAQANQGLFLLPGDCLLLCSDGLTDLVQDVEILSEVLRNPLGQAVVRLVALANQRGGFDNITVVGLQVPASSSSKAPQAARASSPAHLRKKPLVASLAIAALFVITMSILLAGIWYADQQASTPSPSASVLVSTASQLPAIVPTGTSIQAATHTLTGFSTTQATHSPPSATLTPWPTHTRGP